MGAVTKFVEFECPALYDYQRLSMDLAGLLQKSDAARPEFDPCVTPSGPRTTGSEFSFLLRVSGLAEHSEEHIFPLQ
jgi:hypothetical protein